MPQSSQSAKSFDPVEKNNRLAKLARRQRRRQTTPILAILSTSANRPQTGPPISCEEPPSVCGGRQVGGNLNVDTNSRRRGAGDAVSRRRRLPHGDGLHRRLRTAVRIAAGRDALRLFVRIWLRQVRHHDAGVRFDLRERRLQWGARLHRMRRSLLERVVQQSAGALPALRLPRQLHGAGR